MPDAPIFNAGSLTLDQGPNGNYPNVQDALYGWLQPMTFATVVKTVGLDFQVSEVMTEVSFLGTWMPFTPRQVRMKPEGQRKWKWFTCHALPTVDLQPDQIVIYQTTQYRVRDKIDYKLNGYIEYHLVQDYSGSGPQVAP